MSDEELSQRDRRRQQNKSSKSKVSLPRANLKQWTGPLILLLLVGAVVGIMVISDNGGDESGFGCNAHYHSGFDLFLDSEKVLLNAPGDNKFVDTVGRDLHMHSSASSGSGLNLMHAHFAGGANVGLHPENCFSYNDIEDTLSMEMNTEGITLRAIHGEGLAGEYPVNASKTITAWGKGWEDDAWVELDLDTLGTKVPPMSSRTAFIYGEQPADVQAFLEENATAFPVASYPPSDEDSENPPHYLSFDDLTDKP